ncbi:YkyA family protein [Halobacillus litoralis]|uniref:YkyA family protein n=1 Tax=Halobacillus litoralis TaxID=45668 RepID=UPI001CFD4BC5|nr:YkyA family protein [Halobacillus litoralis]
MRVHRFMALLAAAALFLTACTGPSAEEDIYDHLEEAVKQEDTFREQQQPMVDLETKEQELYDQIINLDMDQFDEIKKKSQEAASLVEKRREKLELEKESIEAAKEEFDEIKPIVEDLGEEKQDVKEKAQELIDVMDKRYNAYQDLYKAYDKALTLDAELYEMMQNKDLKEENLQSQIEKINESYNQVIENNESFNEYTEQYNKLKKELYNTMDLEVTYEETNDEEGDSSEEGS